MLISARVVIECTDISTRATRKCLHTGSLFSCTKGIPLVILVRKPKRAPCLRHNDLEPAVCASAATSPELQLSAQAPSFPPKASVQDAPGEHFVGTPSTPRQARSHKQSLPVARDASNGVHRPLEHSPNHLKNLGNFQKIRKKNSISPKCGHVLLCGQCAPPPPRPVSGDQWSVRPPRSTRAQWPAPRIRRAKPPAPPPGAAKPGSLRDLVAPASAVAARLDRRAAPLPRAACVPIVPPCRTFSASLCARSAGGDH